MAHFNIRYVCFQVGQIAKSRHAVDGVHLVYSPGFRAGCCYTGLAPVMYVYLNPYLSPSPTLQGRPLESLVTIIPPPRRRGTAYLRERSCAPLVARVLIRLAQLQ
jgi:hypothetical protein